MHTSIERIIPRGRILPPPHHLAAEAFGTFCMVFVGAGSIVFSEAISFSLGAAGSLGTVGSLGNVGIGAAFGVSVFAVILILGRISGAHINLAVTLGIALLGRFPLTFVAPYWGAQLAGASAAALLLRVVSRTDGNLGGTTPSGTAVESLLVEIVISCILMSVIATNAFDSKASRFAVAVMVGATVGVLAILAGPISGASINPARSFGPAVVSGAFAYQWVYWVGPLVGMSLTALVVRMVVRGKSRRGM